MAVAEFVDGVDHEAVLEAVADLGVEAVGFGAAVEAEQVFVGVGSGVGDRHVEGVFRQAEVLGSVRFDKVRFVARPGAVLGDYGQSDRVHFKVVAVENVPAGHAEIDVLASGFAAVNMDGAAVVFLAHFLAV